MPDLDLVQLEALANNLRSYPSRTPYQEKLTFDAAGAIDALLARVKAAEAEKQRATGYAETLATELVKRLPDAPPQWRPLIGDLLGLLTQIDNATMGFVSIAERDAANAAGISEGLEKAIKVTDNFKFKGSYLWSELAAAIRGAKP